jgi:hypothetical protein
MGRFPEKPLYMVAFTTHIGKPAKVPDRLRDHHRALQMRYFAGSMAISLIINTRVLFGSIIGGRPNSP